MVLISLHTKFMLYITYTCTPVPVLEYLRSAKQANSLEQSSALKAGPIIYIYFNDNINIVIYMYMYYRQ